MNSTPLVSVIISTYNRARFLHQAIGSVLDQTYPRLELYVADDGSTDETPACVASFGRRLTCLRMEHTGHSGKVRNAALQVAQGDLIAFLDDDDVWRPDKLARQVAAFQQNAALGLVYSDVQLFYPDGSLSGPVLKPGQRRQGSILDELIADCFVHPSTVVVPRRLFEELGLFETWLPHQSDYFFWLRAAHAAPACCVPEPLTLVRKHETNIADKRGIASYEGTIQLLEYLPQAIPLTARQRLVRRRALARYYAHTGLHQQRLGQPQRARPLFVRSLRLYPLQRRAWLGLIQGLAAARQA